MDRRSFLKRLGLGAAAVAAAPLLAPVEKALALPSAPLYIPSERLDFGVPSGKLIVPEPPEILKISGGFSFPTDEEVVEALKILGGEAPPFENLLLPRQDWGEPPIKTLRSQSLTLGVHRAPGALQFQIQESRDGKHWRTVGDPLEPNGPMTFRSTEKFIRCVGIGDMHVEAL